MIAIRNYTPKDLAEIERLHQKSGLPQECLPNLENPLFFLRKVVDDSGTLALLGCLKLTAEAFVLVDHGHETPEWRWLALQKLTGAVLSEAAKKGVDQVSCWLPPQLEEPFSKRLETLGFLQSPWKSWTVNLG